MITSKYLVGTYVKINSSYFNEDIIGKTGVITDIYTKIQCFGTEKYTETFSYEVDILNVDKPILIKEEYLTPRPKLDFEAKIILLGLYKSGYKYIVKDKNDCIFAYINYPVKTNVDYPVKTKFSNYSWSANYSKFKHSTHTSHMLNTYLNKLCSWEDLEPTSIAWLLGINEDNISEHSLN